MPKQVSEKLTGPDLGAVHLQSFKTWLAGKIASFRDDLPTYHLAIQHSHGIDGP